MEGRRRRGGVTAATRPSSNKDRAISAAPASRQLLCSPPADGHPPPAGAVLPGEAPSAVPEINCASSAVRSGWLSAVLLK